MASTSESDSDQPGDIEAEQVPFEQEQHLTPIPAVTPEELAAGPTLADGTPFPSPIGGS